MPAKVREIKLPLSVGCRLEPTTAKALQQLAALAGHTVSEELRAMIRAKVFAAHLAGYFPGEMSASS